MNWNHGSSRTGFRLSPLRSNFSGFTLLELMVTVVIFGILAALVLYNWTSFVAYQELRKEAGVLQKEIASLKTKALRNNVRYSVAFNYADNSYKIYRDDNNDGAFSESEVQKTDTLNSRVKFNSNFPGTSPTPSETVPSNGWTDGLTIQPVTLNAFESGRVFISNKNSDKGFAIQKSNESVQLNFFYWNGSSWEEM